jgi:hypothetical protein
VNGEQRAETVHDYAAFSAYRLPLTAYRLPFTAYRLPFTAYRLPLSILAFIGVNLRLLIVLGILYAS